MKAASPRPETALTSFCPAFNPASNEAFVNPVAALKVMTTRAAVADPNRY